MKRPAEGQVSSELRTFPRTSRGSLELMRTGLTLSPDSRPPAGARLSKIPSNLLFSSCCKDEDEEEDKSHREDYACISSPRSPIKVNSFKSCHAEWKKVSETSSSLSNQRLDKFRFTFAFQC